MNIRLDILRLLLEEGEDVSLRELARRLDISSSLAHYHMKKMSEMGILIHQVTGDGMGYYTPQRLFDEDAESTLELLRSLSEKIEDCTNEKLANCVRIFLKCFK